MNVAMKCRAVGMASLLLASAPVGTFAQTPPANRGFQIALRTGAAVPFGKVVKDLDLSDYSSVQVPFLVDIGGKPIKELFIGGYLGVAVGGPAGNTAEFCERRDAGCAGFGWRLGAEVQYHFIPGGSINPWVGYGLGWEAFALGVVRETAVEDEELDENDYFATAVAGYEFAHLMGGADFRLNRIVGLGPFVDVSFGRYTDTDGNDELEDADRATHGWVSLGVRVVFFP